MRGCRRSAGRDDNPGNAVWGSPPQWFLRSVRTYSEGIGGVSNSIWTSAKLQLKEGCFQGVESGGPQWPSKIRLVGARKLDHC